MTDAESILHFAEIGVVLMLFIIGLELDPQRLWKLRAAVFGGGALQMVILRRPAGAVLHVTWAALAGRGIDRHDAGALLYGDCHAGDE